MKDLTETDLCALIGSRMCHDLISPIGAISNGMELLEMTSGTPGPEMDLIRQSVDNVNARIRYFRIAFGQASRQQETGRAEITNILSGYFPSPRLSVNWHPLEDIPRREAKAAFLALLCVEGALPSGGTIDIRREGGTWRIVAQGSRLRIAQDAWDHLTDAAPMPDAATHVHFGLLKRWADSEGRTLSVGQTDIEVAISF
jgi:histidine phosphotransferase ChpT